MNKVRFQHVENMFGQANSPKVKAFLLATLLLIGGTGLAWMVWAQPLAIIVGLAGFMLVVLFLIREEEALFILVAYTSFHQIVVAYLPNSPLTGWKDFVLLVFFGLWALRRLNTRTWTKSPLDIPVILFLLILVFNLLRAPSLPVGLVGLKWHANFIPLYFIGASLDLDKKKLKFLATLLVVLGAINALYGLGTIYGPPDIFRLASRYTATVSGNIYAAHWLNVKIWALSLIMGISLLSAQLEHRYKYLVIISSPILFAALVLSLLRVAWVTSVIGLLFLAIIRKEKKVFIYLLIGVLAVFVFFPPYIIERIAATFSATDVSRYNKEVRQIPIGIQMIISNPLGHGLGTIVSINYRHLIGTSVVNLLASSIGGLENGLLEVGFELGIPGLIAYLVILISALLIGLKTYRFLTDDFVKWFLAGILASFFMVLVGDMYVSYLKGTEAFYWLFLGVLVSLRKSAKQHTL
ncbi:MAG TPA: O-antigen ligase domain-containing protein [Candidatus Scalindua sp.]|nr:O-antigen ligase domain-containing protein [Candidatus Scalindua sp.]